MNQAIRISQVDRGPPQAQARRVNRRQQPLPPSPTMHIDPSRIRHALAKIIQHALKHSEPQHVAVLASIEDDNLLQLSVAEQTALCSPCHASAPQSDTVKVNCLEIGI